MIRNQLMELVRAGLWGVTPDEALFAECRWEELMTLASEQSLIGLVLDGVSKLPAEAQPDRIFYMEWLGVVCKIQKRNELLDKATIAIDKRYRKMGIAPIIMKGQVVATEYPNPHFRQSGDVDICFRTEEESRNAYEWVETSPKCDCHPIVNEKEQAFDWGGVTFENHQRIADMAYAPYQKRLQEVIKESLEKDERRFVSIEDVEIETLPTTLALFHLLVHIEYHLLNEGVGWRQFCDIAVYTAKHAEELKRDSDRLNRWLKDCGLERIAAAIGWVLHKELRVEKDLISWNMLPEGCSESFMQESSDMIISDIWTGGNFGKKKWQFKSDAGFFEQKIKALPLHWAQYRKFRHLLPHEARANFLHKFRRAARGVK